MSMLKENKVKHKRVAGSAKLPTSGRIGRIVKKLITAAGLSTAGKVMKGVDRFDTLSSTAKADYIRDMIARMKQMVGRAKSREILVSCGMMCCGTTSRRRAAQIGQQSKTLKNIIQKLNESRLGGGRLKLKDTHTITGGYNRCYCGMVNKTRAHFPDLTYCHCSTGWYKQLFETALGQPVEVVILKSILCGAKTCEFVIRIKKK